MAEAPLNRRMTVRLGPSVACARIGIVGFDGPIDLQAPRLYGLPEAAPACLQDRRRIGAACTWGWPASGTLAGPALTFFGNSSVS
jgi:hypothetical protein